MLTSKKVPQRAGLINYMRIELTNPGEPFRENAYMRMDG